jgi:hypothetical protein
MKKQCSECRTVYRYAAPYCEACGCHLLATLREVEWKYSICAIAVGLVVAVLQYLFAG